MNHDTYVRMLPVFVHETEECLYDMDEAILALSRNPADAIARQRLSRAAHTVAGNAAAIGYHAMLPDAQSIELTTAAIGVSGISTNGLSILIESRNKLRRLLAAMPVAAVVTAAYAGAAAL